jgi:arylsulfatase A-like enzyme/Tfp pilus assembly protein PilF
MWVLRRFFVLLVLVECSIAARSGPQTSKTNPSGSSAGRKPTTASKISKPGAGFPNVILITLDTTRADRMGFLGSQRGLTPNLDALAKDGVVFTRAFSHVPLTPPSHATILTGTYPQYNHVDDFGSRLGKDVSYLPDILHPHGYRTAAFVSSVILDPIVGSAPGFERGFDVYDAGFHHRRPGEDRYKSIERRADEVVSRAEDWLQNRRPGPFFLWLHFYDAHDPYDPPEPFKTKYADALYDGEIAYTDSVVGKFFNYLRAKGLYDRAMISIMADHGEALGDHGETAHGVFLYDETIHVPLLIKLPGGRSSGKRIERRAGLVDVAPTILQTVGLPVPKEMQGESQLTAMGAITGENALGGDRPAFAETVYPRKAFGFSSLRALRTGKYLFVEAPRKELYDQSIDPQARQDLSAKATAVTDTLTHQTEEFRKNTASSTTESKEAMDPDAQANLNALGYVASDDVKVGPGVQDTGADPKDKVQTVNLLHDAILDIENTRYEDAIPLLQRVLTTDPGIPMAYMQLGTAYSWLKQYEQAIPVLRKAVEMRPDTLMPNYLLGLALSETNDWPGSIPYFEAAAKKSPKWGALHFSLAAAYARVNRAADAEKELRKTVEVSPKDFRALLVLGRMLSLNGSPADGVPVLKEAVKIQPDSITAHLFLAEAYSSLGQSANARRERAEAERLQNSHGPEQPPN